MGRTLTAAFGAALLIACGGDTVPETDTSAGAESVAPGAERTGGDAALDLFVEAPAAEAQVVFIGADSTIRPAGHAGAVFVPMSAFSVERDGIPNEFPAPDSIARMLEDAGVRDGRVVIVGEPIPAGRAYAAFDYLGLGDQAALLDGGLPALQSPATPQTGSDTAAMRTGSAASSGADGLDIDVRDDMIVDAAWVHDRLDDPGVAIIDARPPAEFSGETPGEGIERPGHIPGARNVFWQTLVESVDNPRLKDEAELRRIFEEAGVAEGDIIVTYCRTGGQSAFLYTVARHLGYDVRLYDGSFIDWSRTDFPVER